MQKSIRVFTNQRSTQLNDPFAATMEQVSDYLSSYEVANESKDIQVVPQVTETEVSIRYTVTVIVTW